MIIRLATTDDVEQLRELVVAYGEEVEERGTERNDALLLDAIVYGVRAGEAVVVAEHLEDIVGWCAWVHLPMSPRTKCEGLGTYVTPEWRHDGVSRKLRDFAERHATALGYRYVDGCAAEDNIAGFESVMRMGFRVIGRLVRLEFGANSNASQGVSLRGVAAEADG